ncbi:MAG: excinuclease ABC subunit UvrC [Chloroflexota bacterium]
MTRIDSKTGAPVQRASDGSRIMAELGEKRPRLATALERVPDQAGVYLFKDAKGRLLYVGKAESLRSRVRSYFQSGELHSLKIHQVVAQAEDLEWILTDSPVQALIWENDLVRKEQPRYNTKLRDDKHYPYLRVNVHEDWPVVRVTRKMVRDGARYFGPYPHATSVRQTLDTLSRLFPHILCDRTITGNDPRPCLYFHIKRCPAPCIGEISKADYRLIVDEMLRFLEGKNRTVLGDLRKAMEEAAENLEFERAADLRDRLRAAEKVIDQEKVGYTTLVDQDILGFAREGAYAGVQAFFMREGQLLRRDPFFMENAEGETDQQILSAFVTQFYGRASELPDELVLPMEIEDPDSVGVMLKELAGHTVRILVPQRGERRRVVQLATENAREALSVVRHEWSRDEERLSDAMDELQEYLQLPNLPLRIECYDISNIQGTSQVASMVVFEEGKSKRSDYKRFQIKSVEGANDFASMQEVLRRRFRRARQPDEQESSWANLPDLVIIDGGKGQLGAALEVFDELDITEIPVVGLAKENEELFLPGRSQAVMLPRTSQSLFLVQRIRDEAHRFAITYHRNVRGKRSLGSALDEIPGIGPTRKRALLRHFGSVKAIREADLDALMAVPGINRVAAEAIKRDL